MIKANFMVTEKQNSKTKLKNKQKKKAFKTYPDSKTLISTAPILLIPKYGFN